MPAEAPEIGERGGCPWTFKERWPAPGWLSEEDATYERGSEVNYVDYRVNHYASAYGTECCPGETRDHAQGRIKDGVSCGIVDGGSDTLHEVEGDVKRYEFE